MKYGGMNLNVEISLVPRL